MKHIYLIWCLCLQNRYIMKLCLLAIGFVLLLSIDEGESWPSCRVVAALKCSWSGCHFTYKTVCSAGRKKRSTEEVSSINRQIHTYSTYICNIFSLHTHYTPFSFVLWFFSLIQDIRKTSAFGLYINMW